MSIVLKLTPRDPLIARDGRPFGMGQGLRMKSLDWPYPSVLAGSLRSYLFKREKAKAIEDHQNFNYRDTVESLKQINIAGPLPYFNGQLYLPAPKDLLVYEDEDNGNKRRLMVLRPEEPPEGGGCDLPDGLWPVSVTKEAKPAKSPAFWSMAKMTYWLLGQDLEKLVPPENPTPTSGFLDAPGKDERMHVSIDADTYTAKDGMLFKTVGLDMTVNTQERRGSLNPHFAAEPLALSARVEASGDWRNKLEQLSTSRPLLHPLGGERRLVRWETVRNDKAWQCPTDLTKAFQALTTGQGVRLVLATPGIFQQGWLPDWIDCTNGWKGIPPGSTVELQLIGACVERWKPISGWGLENGKVGPKAIRRLVPAGSVYFFKVTQGSAAELLDKLWLRSVADGDEDDGQSRRDGFGLALWGLWNPQQGGN